MSRRIGPAALLALTACGGTDLSEPATLEVVASSNNQTAPAGGIPAGPLQVVARSDDGLGVVSAPVRWTVTEGTGAVLSDSVSLSDGTGTAQVTITLGPTTGTYRVRAQLVPVPDQAVLLTATATAPPSLTAVTPSSFTGGDTLTLTGSALTGPPEVEIGGQRAQVVAATATSITTIAPYCLVAGPVQVRVLVQRAPSNVLTGTFVAMSAPLALAVGQFVSLDPAQVAGCATFPAAGAGGAEYLLTAQSVSGTRGDTASYVLGGSLVPAPPPASTRQAAPLPPAVRFHDFLRAKEREAAQVPLPPGTTAPAMDAAVQVQNGVNVGDRRQFRVCSTLTCSQLVDFAQVSARARWVGRHAAIFVDEDAPAGFTDADLDSLGQLFDDDLYEVDTRAFGAESDVDENGVIAILFTPVVNGLTDQAQCETSIITGFFFGIDIDPAFQQDARSNKGEVFYALAPDPQGTVSCDLTVEAVRRFVQVTFVHEFQHMISYNQHRLQRNGDVEVLWLNEALSHLAEELAAFRFLARGDSVRFTRFALGDVFNTYQYLTDPGKFFVLPRAGTGTLEERGAAWLFVRWLVDRFGDGVTRSLVETRRTGAENVEAVIGEPLSRLLAEWFLANWVSDLPGFTAPARLTYTTWRFRTTFESLHDQDQSRFPRPFPIEPQVIAGGAGSFTGMLRAGSGDYYRVAQSAGDPGFSLSFTRPDGSALPGNVMPRLSVIRIR